jgi:hypothetical protein
MPRQAMLLQNNACYGTILALRYRAFFKCYGENKPLKELGKCVPLSKDEAKTILIIYVNTRTEIINTH